MVYDSRMTREDPQMKIRLPQDLKTLIEATAGDSGRSLNAEIVARLQRSFEAGADAVQLEIVVEALKAENKSLQAQVESCRRVAKFMDGMNTILAETLVKAIDRMTKKQQEEYAAVRAFAYGSAHGDADSLGAGLIGIYQDDPKMVGEIERIIDDVKLQVKLNKKAKAK